jgi:hypothetical protein
MRAMMVVSLAWALSMLVGVACGGDEDDKQQFGEACELQLAKPGQGAIERSNMSDCESEYCMSLDGGDAYCTASCATTADCPAVEGGTSLCVPVPPYGDFCVIVGRGTT